jgi:hypothetical protein
MLGCPSHCKQHSFSFIYLHRKRAFSAFVWVRVTFSNGRVSDIEALDRTTTQVFHFRFILLQIRTLRSGYSISYEAWHVCLEA